MCLLHPSHFRTRVQQEYCEGGGSRGEKLEKDFLTTLLPGEHLFGSGGLGEDLVETATYWPPGYMKKVLLDGFLEKRFTTIRFQKQLDLFWLLRSTTPSCPPPSPGARGCPRQR